MNDSGATMRERDGLVPISKRRTGLPDLRHIETAAEVDRRIVRVGAGFRQVGRACRYFEIGPAEVGPAEFGFSEDGPGEVGPGEVGPEEVGPAEVGVSEVGQVEVGVDEEGPAEVGAFQVSLVELGLDEDGIGEVNRVEGRHAFKSCVAPADSLARSL